MSFWDHFENERLHHFVKASSKKHSCEFCSDHWGTIVRIFGSQKEFEESDFFDGEDSVKGDPKANIAVWPGKNNVGRNENSWWLTAPVHPLCGCEIDHVETAHESQEELEDWYSKLKWD